SRRRATPRRSRTARSIRVTARETCSAPVLWGGSVSSSRSELTHSLTPGPGAPTRSSGAFLLRAGFDRELVAVHQHGLAVLIEHRGLEGHYAHGAAFRKGVQHRFLDADRVADEDRLDEPELVDAVECDHRAFDEVELRSEAGGDRERQQAV